MDQRNQLSFSSVVGTAPRSDDFPALGQADYNQQQHDQYGLFGLIDVIRMTEHDTSMVSLGLDLTALGLNLNSQDPLNASFMSPFATEPAQGHEPLFNLPQCYILPQNPPPILTKIPSFQEGTLFYIFYSMPREQAQEAAAQELYNRGWRFHKELRLWLTKEPNEPAVLKGTGFERGIYLFFDPSNWAKVKKEWVLYYDQLEERALILGLTPTSPMNQAPRSAGPNSTLAGSKILATDIHNLSGSWSGVQSNNFDA